mmetsp:Transcript_27638/g.60589  ORF Transcript_27638/g.60589 Transcript_27638/m.60589 type:complete len:250 (+) Transcript_27638:50-799(+)
MLEAGTGSIRQANSQRLYTHSMALGFAVKSAGRMIDLPKRSLGGAWPHIPASRYTTAALARREPSQFTTLNLCSSSSDSTVTEISIQMDGNIRIDKSGHACSACGDALLDPLADIAAASTGKMPGHSKVECRAKVKCRARACACPETRTTIAPRAHAQSKRTTKAYTLCHALRAGLRGVEQAGGPADSRARQHPRRCRPPRPRAPPGFPAPAQALLADSLRPCSQRQNSARAAPAARRRRDQARSAPAR